MTLRRVVLVGLMATGKTSIGVPLAEQLGWPYVDVDERIRATTGRTVREIDEAEGPGAHRPLEDAIALEELSSGTPSVLGLPAGSVERPDVREALTASDVFVIWLRADPALLAPKVEASEHRPRLFPDALTVLRRMAADRDPLFRAVADISFDRGHLSKAEATRLAVEAVRAAVDRPTG